jgi:hypothetical protein
MPSPTNQPTVLSYNILLDYMQLNFIYFQPTNFNYTGLLAFEFKNVKLQVAW